MGGRAAAALRTGSAWRVLAVFRRSFYCRDERGALICVGPPSLGAGPLNLLGDLPDGLCWDAGLLSSGEAATSDGRVLWAAERWSFRFAQAAVWRPGRPGEPIDRMVLSTGLARLAQEGGGWPGRGGLQPLVPWLAQGSDLPPGAWAERSPLIRMALPGATRLRRWLEEGVADPRRSPAPSLAGAEGLLGLGPGLTPSGDDLIGGALVALHALGHPELAGRLAAALLPAARERTNAISLAHLEAAADGEGSATLHETLATLSAPGSPGLGERLRAVDAIGHSSGWDALAGATLVAAVVARRGRA
jgi:hypothetical protein